MIVIFLCKTTNIGWNWYLASNFQRDAKSFLKHWGCKMTIIAGYKITLGYAPKQGARALQVPLNFNSLGVTQITFDTFKEQSTGQIEFVQSVFIDNSQNAMGLALRFPALGQVLTVRTQMVGYFPIFVPNGAFSCTAITLGNVNINLIFSDVFINPTVWQAA